MKKEFYDMSPLNHTLFFIVSSLGNLFILAILLRFLLQMVRADFYNPISQAVIKITGPLLHPVRRLIPGFKGIDTASLLLAVVCEIILIYLLEFIARDSSPLSLSFSYIAIIAIYRLINLLLNIYMYGLIIIAIASWVAPGSHNPVLVLIHQLTDPLAQRVRRVIPPLGGLDFSLMVIVFAIMAIQNFLPSIFNSF